jgi:hypothetical protein
MATRTKTIRTPFNFGNVADIADNVLTTFGTTTIHTPENSVSTPITFESVMLYITWQSTVTNASVNDSSTTLILQGSTASTVSISGVLPQTGEESAGVFGPINYTSYFTTNYGTATSKNLTGRTTIDVAAGVNRGVYGYLETTYQFNDSASTQTQTICIPYEFSGSLATTQTTIQTLQQLTGVGGILSGYSDLSIKDRWIQLKGSSTANNTTNDITLSFSFDGGATSTLPIKEQGGGSDTWVEYQIDALSLTENSTHTFQLWSNVASRFTNIITNEWITFEFTPSGTTGAVNYFEFPLVFNFPLGTTSATFQRYGRNIVIPEPSTITMLNCAVEIIYNTNAAATPQIRVGTQNFVAYTTVPNIAAGCYGLQHRFDSGSGAGSGLTLVKGENTIYVDLYQSVGSMSNVMGIIKLLYKSGVSTKGISSHSRTVAKFNRQINFTTSNTNSTSNNFNFLIDEGNYFIYDAGYQSNLWVQSNGMLSEVSLEVLSGEIFNAGDVTTYKDWYLSDNEIAYTTCTSGFYPYTKLFPQDLQNLLDLTQTRNVSSYTQDLSAEGSKLIASYHNITSVVSGNITGSQGGTIRLNIYQESNTGEYNLYQTKSVTGNTSYSFDVYDDTVNYQVVAYETASYKGVSKTGTPATDFDISLTSSAGGEYGYAFG